MTEERVKQIADAIEAYADKESLFAMSPEEATTALNAGGGDFTVDEIKEIGEALVSVSKTNSANGELDESALEGVSGGLSRYGYTCLQTLCCVGGAACMVAAVCW